MTKAEELELDYKYHLIKNSEYLERRYEIEQMIESLDKALDMYEGKISYHIHQSDVIADQIYELTGNDPR